MRCLSSWAIWDSSEPVLPKGRELVAAIGSDVDRRQSGRCKPRLLHLGRPLSVTLRQSPQTAPMYGMYLRGVWDYRRNRRCQDGRLEVYVKGGCAPAELRQIRIWELS
ncbi:hypothetical protein PIB30_093912 [Stylosanthes scabra]|uniref:Uncharacterized protein n=1 Tax=Stylosanthes scabra TaxID=79078 RepID=A0ABU6UXN5_9FABA|nr:hypothetical protein [Stylosanthes scabra]